MFTPAAALDFLLAVILYIIGVELTFSIVKETGEGSV
jgi:hypothetical protein